MYARDCFLRKSRGSTFDHSCDMQTLCVGQYLSHMPCLSAEKSLPQQKMYEFGRAFKVSSRWRDQILSDRRVAIALRTTDQQKPRVLRKRRSAASLDSLSW